MAQARRAACSTARILRRYGSGSGLRSWLSGLAARQAASGSLANFGRESLVFHQSSNFLKYDFYGVATATAFCRAAERVVDLAHPQTRRTARSRGPDLGVAEQTIMLAASPKTPLGMVLLSRARLSVLQLHGPQLESLNFSRRSLRQVRHILDEARVFVRRQAILHESFQLGVRRLCTTLQYDEGLGLGKALGVRHANDGGFKNRGILQERCLHFERTDIDAADWEAAAVEQEARRETDPWEDFLAKGKAEVVVETASGGWEERSSSNYLFMGVLRLDESRINTPAAKRLATCRRKLGWRGPEKMRIKGEVVRGYARPAKASPGAGSTYAGGE